MVRQLADNTADLHLFGHRAVAVEQHHSRALPARVGVMEARAAYDHKSSGRRILAFGSP
jgi:hypothetical protein